MEQEIEIDVMIADASHEVYVDTILDTIESAAKVRGTGIAKRTHEYVAQKMKEGKAVIALAGNEFAGFSYIESWGNKQYVTTSGLIVHPNFRVPPRRFVRIRHYGLLCSRSKHKKLTLCRDRKSVV